MGIEDITWKPLYELVELMHSEAVSPVEVAEIFLERVKKLDPRINAFITLNKQLVEEARRLKNSSRAILYGAPIAVKDNIETKGLRTTFGSKLFENYYPEEDAVVVERLKKAGALVLGKTNMPELGLVAFTDNPLVGPTRNPWDLERTVGGSSGGSAAAVAAGMAPAALGNDGGGSIRIPAAFCGVYGFKPSYGRIPYYPRRVKAFIGLHTEGFITRTVRDAALLMDACSGPDLRDPESIPREVNSYTAVLDEGIEGARIAFSIDLGYAVVDEEVERIVRDAVRVFEKVGATVEEIELKLPDVSDALVAKVSSEVLAWIGDKLDEWRRVAYPLYLPLIDQARTIKATEYAEAEMARDMLWEALGRVFKDYDFLVTPTTAIPPFKLSEIPGPVAVRGRQVKPIVGWMPFTYPFNFTGQPAASLPAGLTGNGLPVGLQIVGRPFDDAGVLKASAAYEEKRPWHNWRPKIV